MKKGRDVWWYDIPALKASKALNRSISPSWYVLQKNQTWRDCFIDSISVQLCKRFPPSMDIPIKKGIRARKKTKWGKKRKRKETWFSSSMAALSLDSCSLTSRSKRKNESGCFLIYGGLSVCFLVEIVQRAWIGHWGLFYFCIGKLSFPWKEEMIYFIKLWVMQNY